MAKINWTRESEIWLQDIYNYIAVDDPQAAARTINKLSQKAQVKAAISTLSLCSMAHYIERYFI